MGKLSIGLTALMCSMALSVTCALAANAPPASVASPEVKATWQPGQEDKFHSHPADQVSLYQTDCKLRLTDFDGNSNVISQKHGETAVRMGKPVVAQQGQKYRRKSLHHLDRRVAKLAGK